MPIEYVAFESANQIKLVFVGLNIRDDVASKYEIIMNLDGTVIEGNSNVKLTLLSLEPDLSNFATKDEIPDVSELATKSELASKQDVLVSGTTIRTLNGVSLLGSGDIQFEEGSGDYTNISNKPSINGVELSGNKTSDDLGLASKDDIPEAYDDTSLRNELQQTETGVATANSEIEKLKSGKQDTLVSGENIKTINGTSILGNGDITIEGGGVGQATEATGGEIFNDYTNNTATGQYSHAEGNLTSSLGIASHSEGGLTRASGIYSHAEGNQAYANGKASHAEGSLTTANNDYEHAQGIYNVSNTPTEEDYKTIHSIGIGTSTNDRKNAQEVLLNGDHYIIGIGNYDGTNPKGTDSPAQTLQEVVNGKQDALVSGTSIKTVNGQSLLGSGDIEITGGSSEVTWDSVTGKPSFATVATSGAYSDLTGTPDLSSYQPKSDDTLTTTNKTVVGAINELLIKIQELETKNQELESRLATLEGSN